MSARFKGFLLPVLLLTLAGAAWGDVTRIPVSDGEAGIQLLDQTDSRLTFRITVGELAALDVEMTPEWGAEISALSTEPPPPTDRLEEKGGISYQGARQK